MKLIDYFTIGFVGVMFIAGCGSDADSDSNLNILGGVAPEAGGLIERSTVALSVNNIYCSGTLIGPRTVVTAAHCVDDVEQGTINIGFAESGGITTTVSTVGHVRHERFGTARVGGRFDIGILVLTEEAPDSHQPVKIYSGFIRNGIQMTLAGYGKTASGSFGELLATSQPVSVIEAKSDEFSFDYRENRTGACNGDSGGPAFVEVNGSYEVSGATSRGNRACRGTTKFTNLDFYRQWISTNEELLMSGTDIEM